MKNNKMILFVMVAIGFTCFAIGGFLLHPALGIIISGFILLIWAFALHSAIKEEKKKEKGGNHG